MTYTTISKVEILLGRELTEKEKFLFPTIHGSVKSFIDNAISSEYVESSVEETRYYNGGDLIVNIDKCHDIVKVEQVYSDETVASLYVADQDYEARPRNDVVKSWIESRIGRFPSGVANIAVTASFDSGESIPSDIEYVATYMISKLLGDSVQLGLKERI